MPKSKSAKGIPWHPICSSLSWSRNDHLWGTSNRMSQQVRMCGRSEGATRFHSWANDSASAAVVAPPEVHHCHYLQLLPLLTLWNILTSQIHLITCNCMSLLFQVHPSAINAYHISINVKTHKGKLSASDSRESGDSIVGSASPLRQVNSSTSHS